jgi:cell wall-associated NlpC family hydrolase
MCTRSTLLVLVVALAAGGCASTGAVPRPFPTPGPDATGKVPGTFPPKVPGTYPGAGVDSEKVAGTFSDPSAAVGYAVAGTALSLRGSPYRNGGMDPSGFDCSGFIWYVFAQHGIRVPRTVVEQFHNGIDVAVDALEPGDLLFFSTEAPGASHVGMAIGGDEFVHAPSSRGIVRVERVTATYWASRYVGAKRLR